MTKKKPSLKWMSAALELSRKGMRAGRGGPFGAVVVRGGKIVGKGHNDVLGSNDPTAHAEVVAIRAACRALGTFDLRGCELYASCEPCPMCLGAAYWARVDRIVFANTRREAEGAGFGDAFIYEELGRAASKRDLPMLRMKVAGADAAFKEWAGKADKVPYGPQGKK